ncbi:MAG: hypothetical protein OEZ13_10165 [Spirochaetia bacterium]|nr:hypothetical protein [Spirochaetia bacterium]
MDSIFFIPAVLWLIFWVFLLLRGQISPGIFLIVSVVFCLYALFWYEESKTTILNLGKSISYKKVAFQTFEMAFISLPWVWAAAGYILTKVSIPSDSKKIIVTLSIFTLIVWISYALLIFANTPSN